MPRYVLQREDWQLVVNYVFGVVLVSLLLAVPLLVGMTRLWGKRVVLVATCVSVGAFFLVAFAIPPNVTRSITITITLTRTRTRTLPLPQP